MDARPRLDRPQLLGVFRQLRQGFGLVWTTSRGLSFALGLLSLVAGVIPAAAAWVGKLIVDAVVRAAETGATEDQQAALIWVLLELGLVAVMAGAQKGLSTCNQLLRALLGQRVNEMILEKALTLDLAAFEDSELYDRMTRARREASQRPLSLVMRSFQLAQHSFSLIAYGGLLLQLSVWALAVLVVAAIPSFFVETRFSADAFRLFTWRAPETRKQNYLEMLLAREDFAKEVKLFDLGPVFLDRYREIFRELYVEDRALTLRRGDLELRARSAEHGGLLRRVRLDRHRDDRQTHHARRHDHVSPGVQAGAIGTVVDPHVHRRDVRRQSLPLEPLRIPRVRVAGRKRRPQPKAPSPGTAFGSRT